MSGRKDFKVIAAAVVAARNESCSLSKGQLFEYAHDLYTEAIKKQEKSSEPSSLKETFRNRVSNSLGLFKSSQTKNFDVILIRFPYPFLFLSIITNII